MTLSSFALRSSAARLCWSRQSLASVQVLALGAALIACGGDPPPTDRDSGPDVDGGTTTVPDGGDGGSVVPGDAGDGGTSGRMCTSGGACDVIRQDCPSPQGCFYVASMAGGTPMTMCLDAGMAGDGVMCDFVNECLPGFTCNDGVCRHYCCMGSSSDCPAGTGQFCIGLAGSEGIGQCTVSVTCNLVTNEGCAGDQACYLADGDGTLGCFSAGDLAEHAPCENLNSCAQGLACLTRGGATASTCVKFCRISMGAGDCGGGDRMCQSASGLSLPTDFGICPAPAA